MARNLFDSLASAFTGKPDEGAVMRGLENRPGEQRPAGESRKTMIDRYVGVNTEKYRTRPAGFDRMRSEFMHGSHGKNHFQASHPKQTEDELPAENEFAPVEPTTSRKHTETGSKPSSQITKTLDEKSEKTVTRGKIAVEKSAGFLGASQLQDAYSEMAEQIAQMREELAQKHEAEQLIKRQKVLTREVIEMKKRHDQMVEDYTQKLKKSDELLRVKDAQIASLTAKNKAQMETLLAMAAHFQSFRSEGMQILDDYLPGNAPTGKDPLSVQPERETAARETEQTQFVDAPVPVRSEEERDTIWREFADNPEKLGDLQDEIDEMREILSRLEDEFEASYEEGGTPQKPVVVELNKQKTA